MKIRCFSPLLIVTVIIPIFFFCSGGHIAGATDTETGGTIVVGYINKSDGTPTSEAVVSLFPTDYDPVKDTSLPILIDTTNAEGYYAINVPDKGNYNIHAVDSKSTTSLLLNEIECTDSIVHAPTGELTTPGFIRLFLPDSIDTMSAYCYIPGTSNMVWLHSVTDNIIFDSVPTGVISSIQYSSTTISTATVIRTDIPVASSDTTTIYNPDWQYNREIVLNTSEDGADVSGNVVQFPVLIRLNSENFDFSQSKLDGSDIRFTNKDNTLLPYEIEYWNKDNLTSRIWVRVDTIRGNNNTQSIFMYWGNPSVTDSSSSSNVFDTAAGFQGVWHLNEKGNDLAHDATANHFDGTAHNMAAVVSVSGPIGSGRSFDGNSSYIIMPNTAESRLNFPEDNLFTISAWVYTDVFDSTFHVIAGKGFQEYLLLLTQTLYPIKASEWSFINTSDAGDWQFSTYPATSKQWVLLTGVQEGNTQYFYCNGKLTTTGSSTLPIGDTRDTLIDLTIGRVMKEATSNDSLFPVTPGYGFFKGGIAEVRICNCARNADWIKLSFMNQRIDDKLVHFK